MMYSLSSLHFFRHQKRKKENLALNLLKKHTYSQDEIILNVSGTNSGHVFHEDGKNTFLIETAKVLHNIWMTN